MSIKLVDKVQTDLVAAMKAHEELRLSVLRMLKTALKNKEIEKIRPLEETEEIGVLQMLVKQRHESAEQFTKGGRPELAEKELNEIKVLEGYLPAAAGTEEMDAAITAAIAETGASTAKQMGAVVKAARARLTGKTIDGKALSDRVRERLAG
ncbi:MAG TPA: GatB/YqeY domain-containing protein [Candidatus Binatia bacterium]|nr:GatB/YqeY domain-containing protein [Candidatus Binatia bacterium]